MNGFESLIVLPISKAASNQRAGRAGRVKGKILFNADGICYRLYTKDFFNSMYELTSPDIILTSLSDLFLQLLVLTFFIQTLGVSNVAHFDFLDRPSEESIIRSLENLYSLKIIDESGKLTKDVGYKVSEFPIEPNLAVMLINSSKSTIKQPVKNFPVPEKY